jgi:hypothetical protein
LPTVYVRAVLIFIPFVYHGLNVQILILVRAKIKYLIFIPFVYHGLKVRILILVRAKIKYDKTAYSGKA